MVLDFLGIGAQKAGTTWIYEQLLRHPEIQFPAGKEIHFFDKHTERGQDWYVNLFEGEGACKRGEITPAYAFLDIQTIRQIYAINPELKIIYSLRHPIDRAWSGALMALGRAEMTVEEASDQWFLDHFNSEGSLSRGDYVACIDNWLQVFPADSLHIICFDDIAIKPLEVLTGLCEHIGIDPLFYQDCSEDLLKQKVYANQLSYPHRPKLQKKLTKLYSARIKEGGSHPVLGDIFQRFM